MGASEKAKEHHHSMNKSGTNAQSRTTENLMSQLNQKGVEGLTGSTASNLDLKGSNVQINNYSLSNLSNSV